MKAAKPTWGDTVGAVAVVEEHVRELTRVDPDVTDTLPIIVHILQGPPQLLSTDVTSPPLSPLQPPGHWVSSWALETPASSESLCGQVNEDPPLGAQGSHWWPSGLHCTWVTFLKFRKCHSTLGHGVGWGEGHTATPRVVCLSIHGVHAGSLWEGGGGEGPFLLSEAGVGGIVFVQ